MAHPFHHHNEHSKSHSRVHHILKSGGHKSGGPAHGDEAADRKLFRSMIAQHDRKVHGKKKPGRFARGGRTKDKGGNHTHIAVVVPQGRGGPQAGAAGPPGPLPPAGAAAPALPPGGGPGGPGGLPPGALAALAGPGGPGGPGGPRPPGMKRGGRIKKAEGGSCKRASGGACGDASAGNLKKWSGRAAKNSYARGGSLPDAGALSGEGRLQKAHLEKRK